MKNSRAGKPRPANKSPPRASPMMPSEIQLQSQQCVVGIAVAVYTYQRYVTGQWGSVQMVRRTKDEAEKTRLRILDNAAHLFETVGYSSTSVDDICARAGITKGALFHHFKSKKALFVEIWTRLQEDMDAAAQAEAIAGVSADDPYSAFLAGCRAYLEWTARPDYRTIVLLDGPSVLGHANWHKLDYELGLRNMQGGVKYLVKRGLINANHADAMATLFQGALNGIGFIALHDPPPITQEDAYAAFESLVRSAR